MTAVVVALLVVTTAVAAVDWWAVGTDRRPVEYVCKPLVLGLLIAAAVALHPAVGVRREWFLAALVFSLAGDVLLMVPKDLFVAGLGSFLAGHACYIVGLTRHGGSASKVAMAAIAVAVVAALPASRILPAVKRGSPALVAPVALYMVVISAMVATAGATGVALAAGGAILFWVSDASIAWDRFVRPWSWARPWIMITYHLGQAALVLSLI